MAKRIFRLSPHQNGKVLGILFMAVSLIFLVPVILLMFIFPLPEGVNSFPVFFLLMIPIFYFFVTYLITASVCLLYNLFFSKTGGLEFELSDDSSNNNTLEQPRVEPTLEG